MRCIKASGQDLESMATTNSKKKNLMLLQQLIADSISTRWKSQTFTKGFLRGLA